MLKKLLLSVAVATLSFSACSNSSNDPKATAIKVCELAKVADLKGLLPYIGEEKMKTELSSAILMMESFKNSEMGKKMLAQQMEKAKKINCKESTSVVKNDDGTYAIGNKDTSQTFTLKLVDGSWKMFK